MENPAQKRSTEQTGENLDQEENAKSNSGAIVKADEWKWAQSHFPEIRS